MENNNTNEALITIADILRYIKNSVLWILGFIVVCGIVGFAYSDRNVTPKYRSNIEILVDSTAFNEHNSSDNPGDYTSGLRATNTIAKWLVSDAVLNETIDRLGVSDKYSAAGLRSIITTENSTTDLWIKVAVLTDNPEDAEIYLNTLVQVSVELASEIEQLNGTYEAVGTATKAATVTPSKTSYVLIGIAVGLVFGLVFAIIKGIYRTKFESEADVEKGLKLRVIGTIVDDEVYDGDYAGDIYPVSEVNKNNYENLLTNIYFSNVDNSQKVLAFTSTVQHEGKSSTIYNLVNYIVGTNKKVLVIDLDLRKSTVHQYFNLENGAGVTDYVTEQAELSEIIKHHNLNFDIITAGGKAPNPTAILQSERLEELVNTLREQYDYIFIDTTPVFLSDAKLITKIVDSVVYVVAANSTKAAAARDSLKELIRTEANILGAVVTNLKKKSRKYYYNYYHYSEYKEKK